MTSRERLLTILLGITGIVAAGAIALAANAISGDSIGLSAQPVSLASSAPAPKPAPGARRERGDDRGHAAAVGDTTTTAGEPTSGSDPGTSSDSGGSGSSHGGSGDDNHKTSSGTIGTSGNSGPSTSPGSGPGPAATTTTDGQGDGGGGGGGSDDGTDTVSSGPN